MDYRGIITRGYYGDAGGQNTVLIISKGYIGTLSTVLIPDIIRVTGIILKQPLLSSIQLSAPELTNIIVVKPRMTGITLN